MRRSSASATASKPAPRFALDAGALTTKSITRGPRSARRSARPGRRRAGCGWRTARPSRGSAAAYAVSFSRWPVSTSTTSASRLDRAVGDQRAQPGQRRGGGRLAADAVAADHGPRVGDRVVVDGQHRALRGAHLGQALLPRRRRADLDRGRARCPRARRPAARRRGTRARTAPRRRPAPPRCAAAGRSSPARSASRKPLPSALELPRFPPGTITQSGARQPRCSSSTKAAVFWPSMRYGLTLLTTATRAGSKPRTAARPASKSPSIATTVAP